MKSFQEVIERAKAAPKRRLAVACAHSADVLCAVDRAGSEGLADAVLFGKKEQILALERELGIAENRFPIYDEPDDASAARAAVAAVSGGQADIVMKGHLDSTVFLKAVIDREIGLRRPGDVISTTAVLELPNDRLLFLTDPGFLPNPSLEDKVCMIRNNVAALHRLGIAEPKVAVLSTAEKVNPKVPDSLVCAELQRRNEAGELPGCLVAGPISMDLAVSEESARNKHYHHPVAGHADLLVAPNLEVGNTLLKALQYLGHLKAGGFTTGAAAPIVFTSRSDTAEAKRTAIAFAVLLAEGEQK